MVHDTSEEKALRERLACELEPGEAVLVSACLLGVRCRYDGSCNPARELQELARQYRVVPMCPEQLGGLGTPRAAAELSGGDGLAVLRGEARVRTRTGRDVTACFLRGAGEALRLAKLTGARVAVLKEKSPSCGTCAVYRDGRLVEGRGVTAALLAEYGIQLIPLDPPKQVDDERPTV